MTTTNNFLPILAARYASVTGNVGGREASVNIFDRIKPYPNDPNAYVNLTQLQQRLTELMSREYFVVGCEHNLIDLVLAALARCKIISVNDGIRVSGFLTINSDNHIQPSAACSIIQYNFDYALNNYVCKSIASNGAQSIDASELASRLMHEEVLNVLISSKAVDSTVLGYKGNVGDNFGLWITKHLTSLKVNPVGTWCNKAQPVFLSVGSIMQHARDRGLVWGSGCILEMPWQKNPIPTKSIFAGVRGPRSREQLLRRFAINMPVVGDPGLLISDIAPRPTSPPDKELGFVVHGVDKAEFKQRYPDAFIVNNSGSYQELCSDLQRCKRIVSSSLHGLIFAHALGIPCQIVAFGHKLSGGEFKFVDYMQSLGNYDFEYRVDLTTHTPTIAELCEIVDHTWVPDVRDLQRTARESFPLPRRVRDTIDKGVGA